MYYSYLNIHNNIGDIMIYIIIFIAKLIENAIGTLRLILVANGKKFIGAILLAITTMLWLYTAYIVVTPIESSIYRMLAFSLGAGIGSYIGSILEEKLAIGNNLISIMTTNKNIFKILNKKNIHYNIVNIGDEINIDIITPRKKRPEIVSYIRKYDSKATIIFQKVLIDKTKDYPLHN